MPLFRKTTDGKWVFFCPGCQCGHALDARWTIVEPESATPSAIPSVLHHEADGLRCHLWVRKGTLEFGSDCTHGLVGQTVPMVDF